MKRLSKIEKDNIKKWEDIPLSITQERRINVLNPNKYLRLSGGCTIDLSDAETCALRSIINTGEKITIEVSPEDGYIEEIEFYAGDDCWMEETDEMYLERMKKYKKVEWEELLRVRKTQADISKKSKKKEDDEYKLFVRLERKYRK